MIRPINRILFEAFFEIFVYLFRKSKMTEFVNFRSFRSKKHPNFSLESQNFKIQSKQHFFLYMYLKIFENRFTRFWFINVVIFSLVFHYLILAIIHP